MAPEALPVAQPEYILRGHRSQIHALSFYADNCRLLSADADGHIIAWDMITKRPVAGWKAHDKAILGVAAWDNDTIISHGRDSRLVVWSLQSATQKLMGQYVPSDQFDNTSAQPPIIQELTVNTMNFCAFAWCDAPADMTFGSSENLKPILLAVPNTLDSESIDIFYMPAAKRKSTINSPGDTKSGMAMSLLISAPETITVAAGYESGDLIVYKHQVKEDSWSAVYQSRPHSQPILSLCLYPDFKACISSSADSTIVKHPFADADLQASSKPMKVLNTKHSGQQGLSMRNDGRLFCTAGWDSRIRVYSAKTLKELAVLKHHKQGCYETALAAINSGTVDPEDSPLDGTSGVVIAPSHSTAMARHAHKIKTTHWLAAGSKDGNISLWDIF